jgi:RNA-directed DNA polymerase
MRRVPGAYETLCAPTHLWAAWRAFARGKSQRPAVIEFEFDVLRRLARLRKELLADAYVPQQPRLFCIAEPKRRLIAAATVRDRVVHHALHRLLSPQLDRRLVASCYACLPGRGVHRALLACQRAMRRHRFVLLLDIRSYFPSIDPDVLAHWLERMIKDPRLVELCRRILQAGRGLYDPPELRRFLGLPADWPPAGRGLPIGNLTSQWWGNHYLSALDHRLLRELKVPYAQRYMDDIVVFGDDSEQLCQVREDLVGWLAEHRHLRLKNPDRQPVSTARNLTYLGRRVGRATIAPLRESYARMASNLGAALWHPDPRRIERSVAAYRGILELGASRVTERDDAVDQSVGPVDVVATDLAAE